MTHALDIRGLADNEFEACERMKAELFDIPFAPDRLSEVRSVRELDRMYGAYAGSTLVGSITANSFTLSVPGGTVAAAGISGLGLRPEFDGLPQRLALLRHQLRSARERAEPVAALCALLDVPPVYDRVGFAVASMGLDVEVAGPHAVFRDGLGSVEPAREVPDTELLSVAEDSYRRLGHVVPGVVDRDGAWWRRWSARNLRPGSRCLVVGPSRRPSGYAVVSDLDAPATVRELLALDAVATRGLWAAMLTVAGARGILARHRPIDDPLPWLLADSRKVRRTVVEGMWIRLIDLPAALVARAWTSPVDVVVRVLDDDCPWNDGTYRLQAGPDGAECRRMSAEPSLTLDVAALGAAYLGGIRLSTLVHTGLVTASNVGALLALDVALSWPSAAWAPTRF